MSDNREIAIKISNVKKMYKLGQIGGATLQADLQSWWARKRGKEDPNVKIGQEERARLVGQTFMALNGIDLTIYKGEAVGIIGSNGAGKSTMLKLLSRVTAPTSGEIDIYGRITSMLEVGTGFNGEMTGRENVYLNGAILGMTKAEIDAKMEQIIEFSEVRDFIDTPVKRYSSGMYVKLAFSVAAHLDSEIMIMDEVLAVGDMAFQKKCLDKMRDAAKQEGRTVLYVSHNMNTIRQLCDRCIVLDKGRVIFDGEVEEAIAIYMHQYNEKQSHNDFSVRKKDNYITTYIKMNHLDIFETDNSIQYGSSLNFNLNYTANKDVNELVFRFIINTSIGTAVATAYSVGYKCNAGVTYSRKFCINTEQLAPGDYFIEIVAFEPDYTGKQIRHDFVDHGVSFTVYAKDQLYNFEWNNKFWGTQVLTATEISGE